MVLRAKPDQTKMRVSYPPTFYLTFLKGEIPNIIQIITFIGFIDIFSKNFIFKAIMALIIICLLTNYLNKKLSEYVRTYTGYKDVFQVDKTLEMIHTVFYMNFVFTMILYCLIIVILFVFF